MSVAAVSTHRGPQSFDYTIVLASRPQYTVRRVDHLPPQLVPLLTYAGLRRDVRWKCEAVGQTAQVVCHQLGRGSGCLDGDPAIVQRVDAELVEELAQF